jgi:hypothetical protein
LSTRSRLAKGKAPGPAAQGRNEEDRCLTHAAEQRPGSSMAGPLAPAPAHRCAEIGSQMSAASFVIPSNLKMCVNTVSYSRLVQWNSGAITTDE